MYFFCKFIRNNCKGFTGRRSSHTYAQGPLDIKISNKTRSNENGKKIELGRFCD